MWLMTRYGFFSAVCGKKEVKKYGSKPDKTTILLRSRSRDHLETLVREIGAEVPALRGMTVSETTDTDYRYRLVMKRSVYLDLVFALADDVDYTNFKSAAGSGPLPPGSRRAYEGKLHHVWNVMYALQPSAPKGQRSFYDDDTLSGDDLHGEDQ